MLILLSPHKFKITNELYIFLFLFLFLGTSSFRNGTVSSSNYLFADAIRRFMFYIHPVESEFVDYLRYSKFGSIGLCGAYDATQIKIRECRKPAQWCKIIDIIPEE